jgi:hypothetical protein
MKELGAVSDDEMVLVFLRGEIDSPEWGPAYRRNLEALRVDRSFLIDNADLADAHANANRRFLLGEMRGYRRGMYVLGNLGH